VADQFYLQDEIGRAKLLVDSVAAILFSAHDETDPETFRVD
jgi:hypothetical protein